MLNVIIKLNKEDKTFDVKWVLNKKNILEVGKDYCPCCYYRLNNNKNKVKKLIGNLFSEAVIDGVSIKKVHEYYRLFLMDELDVNIVVSKEIIDNNIPLKGIILKDKHVIVEEVSDEYLEEKNKEILDEIKKAFSGIPKDEINDSVALIKDVDDISRLKSQTRDFIKDNKSDVENLFEEVFKKPLYTPEEKAVFDTKEKLVNEMDMMFKIMTAKVKLNRQDLFNEDGTRRSIEEVYEIVQSKKDIDNKTKEFVKDSKIDVENMLKEMFSQPLSEVARKGNYSRGVEIEKGGVVDYEPWKSSLTFDPLEEVFGKEFTTKEESLKKIFEYGRNNFTGDENIGKPIRDVETNYWSKINQIGTTLERVKKIATYDLSVNNEPTFSLKIGKDIFLFNSIEAYFRDGFGKFHNYYLYIDQNGMMQSNISIKEFELFLLSNSFYNIIDFDQQRYLINTSPSMPGTIRFNSDIILLRECKDFHRDFPRVEKLGFVKGIEKFDRLISPNYYRELIVKKGVEKRYSSLLGENKEQNNNDASFIQNICYVDFVKNHLFTFSSNKIEGQELYRISLANDMNLLIDTENYLFNHIGSGKDPSTIFVLTKTACDALKTQIQFQDRGEIKFEICDEICEFIGVGNISPKVNVSQKTFDNNNLSIASENGNPIVYFDVYEDDVKKVLKAFNELSNEAEKLYTLDGSISKDNLAVIHKLNAVVNKEIPNVQYFITEKGKKFLEDTNHHVKLNFDLVRDYTTDNINVNDKEFLYLSVYQNKLKVSLGTNLNQQSKKIFYKISDKNDTLSIKNLSSWISAMYQGEDKEYGYKDILITASALKKLRQEEAFEEMNFEEVEEVK